MGFVTFHRVLQSGIEDLGYAKRIARLRDYYFDKAPELTPYLLRVTTREERIGVQGLHSGLWQGFLTVAGMAAVITSVLIGASAGLLAAVIWNRSPAVPLAVGCAFALGTLVGLMRYQKAAWDRSGHAAEGVVDKKAMQ